MKIDNLSEILKNEPAYRLKQAKEAVFRGLIGNWDKTTFLPIALREELNQECPLEIDSQAYETKDKQTVKAVISLADGLKIESVLMRHSDKRNTVCVSSQVGCALNCSFCATGKAGFKRNLTALEIVEQVLFFERYLKKEKVTNLVFMGMGEPFFNYDNVLQAIRMINDKAGFNLGARHISISTCGIVEGINKFSDEKLEVNLAISLHAPNDELRQKIMPINKKYPIRDILGAVDSYIAKTKRRVMFEYVMIDGVNDSLVQAEELAKIMKRRLYFVNLISCNPTGIFTPSSSLTIKKFKEVLEKRGVATTLRYRFGDDINAACGQLVYKKENR